jgi:uncharacterized protein
VPVGRLEPGRIAGKGALGLEGCDFSLDEGFIKGKILAARHGAHNLRVFGSVARGDDGPESDLDILAEMEPGKSPLDHIALMQDLEDLLQRKVDVVSERALHWYIRDRVLAEATPL